VVTASPAILWLPLLSVAAHLLEEFVWPGGFPEWYRRYRPERAASVTGSFLVTVNAILIGIAVLPPLLGPTPRGLAWWLIVVAVGAVNAAFHAWATVRMREYSPGVVSGVLLYLPLAGFGVWRFVVPGIVAPGTAVQAVIAGVGFHLWSSWAHRRRAAAARGGR